MARSTLMPECVRAHIGHANELRPFRYEPARFRSRHCQNTALSTLLSILLTTKSADVPALVRKLEPTEQDTLMKYLYKGMAAPDESGGNACAVLLSWHEKVRSR